MKTSSKPHSITFTRFFRYFLYFSLFQCPSTPPPNYLPQHQIVQVNNQLPVVKEWEPNKKSPCWMQTMNKHRTAFPITTGINTHQVIPAAWSSVCQRSVSGCAPGQTSGSYYNAYTAWAQQCVHDQFPPTRCFHTRSTWRRPLASPESVMMFESPSHKWWWACQYLSWKHNNNRSLRCLYFAMSYLPKCNPVLKQIYKTYFYPHETLYKIYIWQTRHWQCKIS